MTTIDLSHIPYTFQTKPLLFAGKAMEYYGLRAAGDDVDFIVTLEDYVALAQMYPDSKKQIESDRGIIIGTYEFWTGMFAFDYDHLSIGAIDHPTYRVISLEKLLVLKALSSDKPKNQADLQLIIKKVLNIQRNLSP